MVQAWLLICIVAGTIGILYLSLGLKASNDDLIMPLDDTYIHFQYARQMATGDPYVYNPTDDPTSGATSFLYTPLLAIGYFVGFTDLALSYWAVIIGWLLYVGSAWLIFRLIYQPKIESSYLIALLLTLTFIINGAIVWAAFSGMETSLFVFTTLLAFYAHQSQNFKLIGIAGALAALSRPEGAVIAITLVGAVWWQHRIWKNKWLWLPIIAIFVQPFVNFLVTGSPSATGNQAKSHLYNVTIPFTERLETIAEFWWRLWRELFLGRNPVDGNYVPPIIAVLAIVAISLKLKTWKNRQIPPELLIGLWLILMSIGIATLDTAFWHFKRYQLPLMALMFPLAGWALYWIIEKWRMARLSIGIATIALIMSGFTTLEYARRYHDNIAVVQNQQIAMANWVNENLPPDARIGVHDVGVMRYVGNRATYDLVGLTTPEVASAWRQGAGTIYDTMLTHKHRPDYFAIYHDIQALPLLEQSGVFGDEIARFMFALPENTVASATSTQIVSQANWIDEESSPIIFSDLPSPIAQLNVGDIAEEHDFHYEWWNDDAIGGFSTVVHRLSYPNCSDSACNIIDGGRILSGGEKFDLPPISTENYFIILRVHAATPANLLIGCEDQKITKVVPNRPGEWVDIPMVLPNDTSKFCLEADGIYQPFNYWIYDQQPAITVSVPTAPIAEFIEPIESNQFMLTDLNYTLENNNLVVSTAWYNEGNLTQDGKFFVHIYDDINEPPVRQIDTWFGNDMLPPANWLAGNFDEQVILPLDNLEAGIYTVAIGFYDPNTQARYTIKIDNEDTDRLFIGDIEIN